MFEDPIDRRRRLAESRAGAAIEAREVVKRYGDVLAVDGLSFAVSPGTILALVGPNGSGKTSTVECLEGLRRPDAGTVRLLGVDPWRERGEVYRRVGVLLQEGGYYERIKLREALWLYQSFYARPLATGEILEAVGLSGRESTFYGDLSGGQKRRFLVALALVGRPEAIILDEPTTGLDPQARGNVWGLLRSFRDRGAAILVTTHYLEEAERYCDVAAIVDHGRLLAMDTPARLLDQHAMDTQVALPASGGIDAEGLEREPFVTRAEALDGRVMAYGVGDDFVASIRELAESRGVAPRDIEVRRARLEDLFLVLTGRQYRED